MRFPKNRKDKILDYLVTQENGAINQDIAKTLNIEQYKVDVSLEEMAEQKHIELLTAGAMKRYYVVRQIYPKGIYFQKHKSYFWQKFWDIIELSKKRYWPLVALSGFILGTIVGPMLLENMKTWPQLISKQIEILTNNQ